MANPYRIDSEKDRARVIGMYKKLVISNTGKYVAEELIGKVLLCHCRKEEDCHADFLCDLANQAAKDKMSVSAAVVAKDHFQGNMDGDPVMTDFIDDGLQTRPQDQRRSIPPCSRRENRQERKAFFMGRSRSFEDGGGLCS